MAITWEQLKYYVYEDNYYLSICVLAIGERERNFYLSVTSEDGTATGKPIKECSLVMIIRLVDQDCL